MADDMGLVLRNALDAVNAGRKWTLLGVTALFFAITIALASLFSAGAGVHRDVERAAPPLAIKALWTTAAAEMLLVSASTALIMMHVSRMTRLILRAIEATRK